MIELMVNRFPNVIRVFFHAVDWEIKEAIYNVRQSARGFIRKVKWAKIPFDRARITFSSTRIRPL